MNSLNRQILQGDVLEKLTEIPDETVDVEISSPPYWGLRDYGVEGQLGLEPDFRDYLKTMSKIMQELKRVLKKTGTCWINLGDTYCGHKGEMRNPGYAKEEDRIKYRKDAQGKKENFNIYGVTTKSLFGIPERFYIDCIDNGWIARNFIPWIKANSMPQSAQDRFTNKWEPVFFFAKERKYYFDLDAVREPFVTDVTPKKDRTMSGTQITFGQSEEHKTKTEILQETGLVRYPPGRFLHYEKKQDNTLGADGKPKANYKNFNENWKKQIQSGKYGEDKENRSRVVAYMNSTKGGNENGKNPGDVFKINPRPFAEAHFATFPVDLPLKILKCACPKDGIVLDPFFGAGTVGVAAEMLGLQWCGIELKQEYIDIAQKRLNPLLITKLV